MIVLVNNRDSFVWNLAEYASLFDRVKVVPNTITVGELRRLDPDGVIISPGPGHPLERREVGNSPEIVLEAGVPILGVCLGHQIIATAFGGKVGRVKPRHGKASPVKHDGKGVLRGIKNPLTAGRYHSLAVLEVPREFDVSAVSLDDNVVMGIRHRKLPIEGLQFHPESVLTEWERKEGLRIIKNFVEMSRNG
ncbi:anthranilate synthase, component II [Thermococcus kodakarensis KOD1]|uniref:Anthranilate synthase component 2 n=1 Tax=Thermococcus kodakarensis (strain ATCC BAA-918 / JCM 12380 / KOD1) TaxID=69014 RepID=TRPG_THEKO|nr:aminodeoxychorismate/anthranilate synthase component II [Thermococcus kodakarensis]Q9YGB2.1 RecName: Full=Anthranilate synthase component 2; Short=AS; Short=ASII; AltName: Full=Anthranilate synthase, GATase component; AltName: Full=Anthranilate synthase, glutamine amidotransferase component [Thermococcus kodakarensis KOD1]WCN28341.1 aminodeoxychorismate/anthranilate synthase component II [Thermococcus kodakarensis]WCN30637.1 aminodeoxychorismate/anthranilate synthase component II [Thermococcu